MVTNIIYDSHCHLSALINQVNVVNIAVPAILLNDITELNNYRQKINQNAKIGIGIHPWYIEPNLDLVKLSKDMKTLIKEYQPDFIGETGLDKNKPNFELQLQVFKLHLELAKYYQLPIVIHCVRAYNELLQLLKLNTGFKDYKLKGVVHAYNANTHIAHQLFQHDLYLGIGSIILNPQSQLVKSVAKLNMSQLLIESDAPYMPKKGQDKSTSTDCYEYAIQLASYLQKSPIEVINGVNQNWCKLFM